ncbi:DUF5765 domain-containing protein [Pararhodobacter sp.]|uniref:DUF5765 domain-containing protein n=1 Tax=Pararhodobacter sp. TaxID=2127056 RepID=UPI002AFDDCAE|nr:DUF5765 domain-containing protein [Pararhodobacter sp.]
MCWTMGVSATMVALGGAATAVSIKRGDAPAIPVTLGYFTAMEALQVAGYAVINDCSSPVNQTVTILSVLHIVFQPLVINAFAMELVAKPVSVRMKTLVFTLCALSSILMILQLYPFEWAGSCAPGSNLCAAQLCTVSGDWHQAWDVPFNGLMVPLESAIGTNWGFPSYILVTFALPLLYGAWRLVLFHALAGPILAGLLTSNPNEVPAIWCLFSIAIVLIALSPAIRRRFSVPPAAA